MGTADEGARGDPEAEPRVWGAAGFAPGPGTPRAAFLCTSGSPVCVGLVLKKRSLGSYQGRAVQWAAPESPQAGGVVPVQPLPTSEAATCDASPVPTPATSCVPRSCQALSRRPLPVSLFWTPVLVPSRFDGFGQQEEVSYAS